MTKNFHGQVSITLPDDRNEQGLRRIRRGRRCPSSLFDANATNGIFGYSAAPELHIEGSPSWPDEYNATGYALMFLDRDQSVDIVDGGQGYAAAGGFNANAVRIFGEGYRPPKFDAYIQQLPGRLFPVASASRHSRRRRSFRCEHQRHSLFRRWIGRNRSFVSK